MPPGNLRPPHQPKKPQSGLEGARGHKLVLTCRSNYAPGTSLRLIMVNHDHTFTFRQLRSPRKAEFLYLLRYCVQPWLA